MEKVYSKYNKLPFLCVNFQLKSIKRDNNLRKEKASFNEIIAKAKDKNIY